MMDELTRQTVADIAAAAAAQVLQALGITAGQLSQTQVRKVYGTCAAEAIRDGRLRPCSVGYGKTGRRMYSITDILALRASDSARATIQLNEIKQAKR